MCRNRPGTRGPEMERGVLGAVSTENRDAVTWCDARTEQGHGQPLGEGFKLSVTEDLPEPDNGRPPGIQGRVSREKFTSKNVGPSEALYRRDRPAAASLTAPDNAQR